MGETFEQISAGDGHELVVLCADTEAGYRSVIAVHSTALGPALGGARLWQYDSTDAALTDALRLSRGMTYKCALAVAALRRRQGRHLRRAARRIASDLPPRARPLRRAPGRRYITAEDVGTSPADMEHVLMETEHVGGLIDRSGDPSPATARGVFRAVQASARHRWGTDDLGGRTVALQGCGHVGYHLARELSGAGASLVVADMGAERAARVGAEFGARVVEPREIFDVEADVFAPCALGGVVNDETLPRLRVGVVAGAANNQLLEARHGDELAARGILYAPDYVCNSGGVINGCRELLGWEPERSRRKIEEIYDTLLDIFRSAEREGVSTARAATASPSGDCARPASSETQARGKTCRAGKSAARVSPAPPGAGTSLPYRHGRRDFYYALLISRLRDYKDDAEVRGNRRPRT